MSVFDVERAKFEGFGTYKLPIEERVNEIMEATKKEYPNIHSRIRNHAGQIRRTCR